jgi:hypothetical protein
MTKKSSYFSIVVKSIFGHPATAKHFIFSYIRSGAIYCPNIRTSPDLQIMSGMGQMIHSYLIRVIS